MYVSKATLFYETLLLYFWSLLIYNNSVFLPLLNLSIVLKTKPVCLYGIDYKIYAGASSVFIAFIVTYIYK